LAGGRGEAGEAAAARELSRQGMTLLERNLRSAGAEIDLVGLDGRTIVFIEVKARSSEAFGTPEEAVDREKRRRIVRAARAFLRRKGLSRQPCRYDIAAVDLDAQGRPVAVRWTRAAFDEGDMR
jgi:putative endonuclease